MPCWVTATNRFFFFPVSQILNNRKETPGKLSLMFTICNSKFQNARMASYKPGPSRKAFLMDYDICFYWHKQIKSPACFFNLGSSSLPLETSVSFSDQSILSTHCFSDEMWQLLSFVRQCSTSNLFFWNWGQQRWLALQVMKRRD